MRKVASPLAVDVAYGYIEIGAVDDLGADRRGTPDTSEFLSVKDNVARIQAGTHTGEVELEGVLVDKLPAAVEGRAARGEVQLTLTAHTIFASTFHGIATGFQVTLPQTWKAVRIRATSERYFEATTISEIEDLKPPERILLEFTQAG